jgi:arabinan endo-1,5-alpha-L-arabinosidase
MAFNMKKMILMYAVLGIFCIVEGQNCDTNFFPDGKEYYDTYHEFAANLSSWKHYNTHDPTVNKQGEWYYMYSTDASWAGLNKNGALKRRSKDLVNWEFLGNAFDGVPQSAVDFFKANGNPSYTDHGIWAPFLFKHKNGYILYYSAPGGLDGVNFAFIGYATSDSASGPWEDKGMITTSYRDTINAIDPTVVYDSVEQRLWMAYGSWERGIYILELDTATGGIKTPGDRGAKIAVRKSTSYGLEGPELSYRNGWYYLFVSYDGLGDLYNVRVGRSRNANGPFYDFNGINMVGSNSVPMIQSPYRFNDHPGWQGTGHCGVYNDNGTYYMFNQGRPSIQSAMMVLHVREIFWMDDWPVLSPERYAGVPKCTITADSLLGNWEHMPLIYHSTTALGFHSTSDSLHLYADGTFNSDAANTWTFDNDTLTLNWKNGTLYKLFVFWGWDWENSYRTILYTGLSKTGICAWGKKTNQHENDLYTKLVSGAAYLIRNQYSHMIMEVPNGADADGIAIKQGVDNGTASQLWRLVSDGEGYYYFVSVSSETNRVLEVAKGGISDGARLQISTMDGTDKQKFSLVYKNNGSFNIMTKVSSGNSCFDLYGFSIVQGGMIFQWKYLNGLNQAWRFKRIDSVEVELINGLTPFQQHEIQLYPNPSYDGKFTLDLEEPDGLGDVNITVFDSRGVQVYHMNKVTDSIQPVDILLSPGIYIVHVSSRQNQYISKLVVY